MDIQIEKYKLMEWLVNLNDESIIVALKAIKNGRQNSTDWDEDISKTEKLLIEAGMKDIKEGNTFTHDQVMEEINEVYGI